MTKTTILAFFFFLAIIFLLLVYSFSQIDPNLILSTNKTYLGFQEILFRLGYFQRLPSALIFLGLLISLFLFYLHFIKLAAHKLISPKFTRNLILSTAFLLLFSYPAFSHDIFNYMFDARIVTRYQLNPWQYKALDFPQDTWTRFMHWTHRYYPYGPGWLFISLLPSYLGMAKFTLTLLNFKTLFLGFYLSSCLMLIKIQRLKKINNLSTSLIYFALNPLILIESLVSSHHEIVILFFTLLSFYFLIKRKNWQAFLAILLSAGIKYTTLIYLPLVWWWISLNRKKTAVDIEAMALLWLIFAYLSFVLTIIVGGREVQSWYFVLNLGLGAMVLNFPFWKNLGIILSFALILRYAPFLYLGLYTDGTQLSRNILFLLPLAGYALYGIIKRIKKTKGYV